MRLTLSKITQPDLTVEDTGGVGALLFENIEDGVKVGLTRGLLVDDGQPTTNTFNREY